MEKAKNTKNVIVETLKAQIKDFDASIREERVGVVLEVGDGIALASGLNEVMAMEMLDFGNNIFGVALNLNEETVGAMILGGYEQIKEGDEVKSTGKILQVPVGEEIIGRVINPLGRALDGKKDIQARLTYPVEKIAPRVITREPVDTPLQTGIKAIDSMIPIGRGQRELIIGDRQTGKTALCIDTIINQQGKNVICVYVAIGQKASKVAKIVSELEKQGAMKYTTVILASASDPASLNYLAPYSGVAMGEYFMDQGKDVLVVYDDLSKHAWAYREVSLLLKRPPGREAYPGDVFYLHSRLLERSAKLNKKYGGGSLTALPIIETQAGDISAYIPTNVISITDGQIYLESDLFYQGIRPAVNIGLSVSRVGSAAQIKAMKQVAGKLKLEAAQYRELAAFAQFSSDLDEATKKQLERGKRVTEILKQGQYSPMPVEHQVAIIFSVVNGLFDSIPENELEKIEAPLIKYLMKNNKEIFDNISRTGSLDDVGAKNLTKAVSGYIEDYKKEKTAVNEKKQ